MVSSPPGSADGAYERHEELRSELGRLRELIAAQNFPAQALSSLSVSGSQAGSESGIPDWQRSPVDTPPLNGIPEWQRGEPAAAKSEGSASSGASGAPSAVEGEPERDGEAKGKQPVEEKGKEPADAP